MMNTFSGFYYRSIYCLAVFVFGQTRILLGKCRHKLKYTGYSSKGEAFT